MSHMFHSLCVCGEGWEGAIRGRWERRGDEGGKGYGMKGRRGRENTPCRWQDSISTFFVDWLTSTMVNKYGECVCMYVYVCVCAWLPSSTLCPTYLLLCAGKGVMGGVAEGALSI